MATPRRKKKKPVCRGRTKPAPRRSRKKPIRRRVRRCAPPRRRPKLGTPAPTPVAPEAAGSPPEGGSPPVPPPEEITPAESDLPIYDGPFGVAQAQRLLWRAGFGPRPGEAEAVAALGLRKAVGRMTRPIGPPVLIGPEPTTEVAPLRPLTDHGHDHLWWLDRMVRSNQQLVERMTLVWHDWFATSVAQVNTQLMLEQNELFRRSAFGSFHQLLLDVTSDDAMLIWLNGWLSRRGVPDENYARELMELFTLGADRGAYTEDDVREMARALTGWSGTNSGTIGWHDFRPNPDRHDFFPKTIFGQVGTFDWRDACRLCVEHPLHPSFFVAKLWSYFAPDPPSDTTRSELEALYRREGYAVRPVLEAILLHPELYEGPPMVKPAAVYCAGVLRARERRLDKQSFIHYCELAGQTLFRPPGVNGWDDTRWLDTTTFRGRWFIAFEALRPAWINATAPSYDSTETAVTALERALQFWANPPLSAETHEILFRFARRCVADDMPSAEARAWRQNALRHLVVCSPDYQVC